MQSSVTECCSISLLIFAQLFLQVDINNLRKNANGLSLPLCLSVSLHYLQTLLSHRMRFPPLSIPSMTAGSLAAFTLLCSLSQQIPPGKSSLSCSLLKFRLRHGQERDIRLTVQVDISPVLSFSSLTFTSYPY